MDSITQFVCPQCGGETFKTSAPPKNAADFAGAVCINCGYTLGDEDVTTQLKELADKLIRQAVRKSQGR